MSISFEELSLYNGCPVLHSAIWRFVIALITKTAEDVTKGHLHI